MLSARARLVLLVLCGALLPGRAALGRLSSIDLRWLDRLTYGVNAPTLAEYERLGRKRFIEAQLRGDGGALPRAIADQSTNWRSSDRMEPASSWRCRPRRSASTPWHRQPRRTRREKP